MKKSKITHGAIFAIPLWHSLGYMYGKMLFGSHLKNEFARKKNIYIRVYDYYTADLKKDIPHDFFKEKELFTDLFILMGFPKLRGTNSWKLIRHDPIYEEDEYIPHFLQVTYYDKQDTDDNKEFFVLEYGKIGNPNNQLYPFYRIKHLPIHRLRSYDVISLYLTFEWLRRNGKDIDALFEYTEGLDVKKEIRFEVMNMTVDYRTIPKEIRGMVAPKSHLSFEKNE
jgi:hypothetical protein